MSHAVQEPNFTQQFVLHRYWQQCQCVPRTKLREYEVTREVVRANEQLIMSMRWLSARVFIITAIKLLSSDRSLTIVGASITSTILLRDLGFLAYHLYASTHNTLSSYNLVSELSTCCCCCSARVYQRDIISRTRTSQSGYMLEAPESLFVLHIYILAYQDDLVVLYTYSRTTL